MARMNLALLSDEIVEETAGASDEVVSEIANGPEADLAEVANTDSDLQAVDAAADQGGEDADALDAAAEQVEAANADGGISAPAAEAIRILVDRIRDRNGMPALPQLATESFASKTSRAQATRRLATEDIKGTATKIWEYILKLYERAKAFLIKWWNNFFDAATKIKNRAEKLASAAEAKNGEVVTAGNKKIVAPAYAESLLMKKGVPSPADVVASVSEPHFVTPPSKEAFSESMTKAAAEMLEASVDAEKFKVAAQAFISASRAELSGKATEKRTDVGDDVECIVFAELTFGNKSLYVTKAKDTEKDPVEAAKKIKYFIASPVGAKPVTKLDMEALDPAQVKVVADKVGLLAKGFINQKDKLKEITKGFESVQAAAKRVKSGAEDKAKERASKASAAAKAALSAVNTVIVANKSHQLHVCSSLLTYGAASLALAGKDDKKKVEEE